MERNPTKRDQDAERLGLIEASHELFGDHRVLEASPAVDAPGKERQAAEYYLVNLPFKLLRPLMEYFPTSPYWEPVSQLKTLEYWMRTPYYPQDPQQAHELKWYLKGPGDSKPHSVFRNRQSGKYDKGLPVDMSDIKLAPTGVSVIFAS